MGDLLHVGPDVLGGGEAVNAKQDLVVALAALAVIALIALLVR